MLHARERGEEGVVAARHLGAALDGVAGDHGSGEAVELEAIAGSGLGVGPAVPPRGRSHHERGIGNAARDDDIGTRGERCGDRLATEVGVGGEELHAVRGLAGIEVDPGLVEFADARHEVVAGDDADAHGSDVELVHELGEGVRAALRIESARIGHDADAAIPAGAEHLLHLGEEGACITRARPVLEPLPGEDEHGEFCEPVSGEHVDGSALDHLPGGGDAVAEESAAVGDDHGPVHASASRTATT